MNNPLVQPDPGLFIWTILTFLVLLTLLAKFAWGPLLQALEGRQEAIRKALDDAQQAQGRSWSACTRNPRRSSRQARVEAEAIVDAQPRRRRAAARGAARRRRAPRPTASSRTPSARFSSRPRARSSRSATRPSTCRWPIASKIIQRNLTKEDNERLIDDTLRQLH